MKLSNGIKAIEYLFGALLLASVCSGVAIAEDEGKNIVEFQAAPVNRGNEIKVSGEQNKFSGTQVGEKGKVGVKIEGEKNNLQIDQDATTTEETAKISISGKRNQVTIKQSGPTTPPK